MRKQGLGCAPSYAAGKRQTPRSLPRPLSAPQRDFPGNHEASSGSKPRPQDVAGALAEVERGLCGAPSLSGTLHVRERAEGRSRWLALVSCLAAAAGSRVCWWMEGSVRELTVLRKAGRLLTPAEQAAWAWARRFAAGREAGGKLASVRNHGAPSQLPVLVPPPLGLGVCVVGGGWDVGPEQAICSLGVRSAKQGT